MPTRRPHDPICSVGGLIMTLLGFILAWYLFGPEIAGAFLIGALANALVHRCPAPCAHAEAQHEARHEYTYREAA